jgi:hypothetical protein
VVVNVNLFEKTKWDSFARFFYANKILWMIIQILGILILIYSMQNPIKFIYLEISKIFNNSVKIDLLSLLIGVIFNILKLFFYSYLAITFVRPKILHSIVGKSYAIVVLYAFMFLTPNSGDILNPNFIRPFQDPFFDVLFFIFPGFVCLLSLHKYTSENPKENAV